MGNVIVVRTRGNIDAEFFERHEVRAHGAEPERTAARLWQFEFLKKVNQGADEHQDAARLHRGHAVDGMK